MQAMQSSTASGSDRQFVALRHVVGRMKLGGHASSREAEPLCEVPAALSGIAEGAGLAHDAGNLLGALSLYSDLLALPGVLHDEHREYANELRMLSDRSWAMINRLVNYVRTGQPSEGAKEVSVIPDVVTRCRGLLNRVAGRTIDVSYGVGAFEPVRVQVEAVERILTNLVKNAAEVTPWAGTISIHVEGVAESACAEHGELRRRVIMTVRDKGRGMDAAAVRRLMYSEGKVSANGRGLGFRVVRELVAISGGCLSIESQPEVGTSISTEWYAMRPDEGEAQRGRVLRSEERVKAMFERETGWIAC